MIVPPLRYKAFEFRQRLGGGTTRPLLIVAKDEEENECKIVLKVKKPDKRSGNRSNFGATSLACELICSVIAKHLGFSVPEYGIVEIRKNFAESVYNEETRKLLLENIGENFATAFYSPATSWEPSREENPSFEIMKYMENVLTFDSAILNGDRTSGNANILKVGGKHFLIDHSIALPVCRWEHSDIVASPLFPDKKVAEHCTFKPLQSFRKSDPNFIPFENLFINWQDRITDSEWKEIKGLIPSSWEQNRGEVDKIFEFLQNRSLKFGNISESLRSIVL